MKSRRKISAALLLSYILAMVLNAVVVLTCDCSSCHSPLVHKCHCEMCISNDGDTFLSQHCDCTHSHENQVTTAVTVDAERVFKSIKIAVAELPRTIVDLCDAMAMFTHEIPIISLSLLIDDAPLISKGGLRAPPVFA